MNPFDDLDDAHVGTGAYGPPSSMTTTWQHQSDPNAKPMSYTQPHLHQQQFPIYHQPQVLGYQHNQASGMNNNNVQMYNNANMGGMERYGSAAANSPARGTHMQMPMHGIPATKPFSTGQQTLEFMNLQQQQQQQLQLQQQSFNMYNGQQQYGGYQQNSTDSFRQMQQSLATAQLSQRQQQVNPFASYDEPLVIQQQAPSATVLFSSTSAAAAEFDPFNVPQDMDEQRQQLWLMENAQNRQALNLRRASLLYRQGLINEEDKGVAKNLILQGNKDIDLALEDTQSGNVAQLRKVLASAKAAQMKPSESDSIDDDDDDEQEDEDKGTESSKSNETITDGEEGEGWQEASQRIRPRPPNPVAGGFRNPIPPSLHLVQDKLIGHILMRISSKKLFRKWKRMFFVLDLHRICLYESSAFWENHGPPRFVFRLHACMFIRKPTLKKTYSVMDDGQRVFYTILRENVTEEGSSKHYTGTPTRRNRFSVAMESRRVCKFGSHLLQEVDALAHAIHGVIAAKSQEVTLRNRASASEGSKPLNYARYQSS